ncbi:phage tail assembly protein [Brevundimonas vitis]|uniref:Phage tail assembly protein n=1 Tax=Brevundimonas vitisensis TaxID=2800818 RepID=A0ABX7BQ00_9CAUL|nr:phage tail assembly protein [Brevundimonas vitisensis]QQQ19669.1 phage tail assembly protein [Brevundimonas vitisensis]
MSDPSIEDTGGPSAEGYPDGPVHHVLVRPVVFTLPGTNGPESFTVNEVWMREPTGDDILLMGKAQTSEEKSMRLIAAMCDQPYLFARKLKGWDFVKLGLILARFFPKGASPLES